MGHLNYIPIPSAHSFLAPSHSLASEQRSTTVGCRTLNLRDRHMFVQRVMIWARVCSTLVSFSLCKRRGFPCTEYREFRDRNKFKSTDRLRQVRTVLSVRSFQSQARASASATSRASRGPARPRPIYLTLLDTTRARVAVGWRATPSRLPKRWASSSPRSCGDFTRGNRA